ncbi:MAG: outer membrane lipoprotein carrier protein LolA [Flavobacteriia bacterium]|nr:outer membrane lipoprotein carrier protein LolA [Flavobacteriia bacterium]
MKILFASALLFISFYSFNQEKGDMKSQQILDKLSSKMKEYKTFYIEFNAVIKNQSSGVNENEIGKGWVKGNKFCASYGENTIISNGLKTWTVVKEEKSVYETDVEANSEDNINPKRLMTIWETGFKNKYEKEETLNNEKVHVIYLYPKNPSKVDYHTIILYVSKDEVELKKAIMKAKDGTVMTYTLTKFQTNPVVEDSKFVFDGKKYPGYSIVKD